MAASLGKEEKERLFDEIIEEISVNKLSLRKALIDRMSAQTFYDIIDNDTELSTQYARAREERTEGIFEEMFDIADDGTNDYMERMGSDGEPYLVVNTEHIQRSKVRIDQRKWALSKMNPKKYGDKLELDNKHSGEITTNDVSNLPTDELIKRAEAISKLSQSKKDQSE
jgi:hypothetical protein